MILKEMINCQINIIKREKHSWLMFNFHFPSALIKKIIFKIYPQTWVAAHIAFSFYEPVPSKGGGHKTYYSPEILNSG